MSFCFSCIYTAHCYTDDSMLQVVLRIITITVGLLFAGLVSAMFLTNPGELGPYGITLWFVALLIFSVLLLTIVIYRLSAGDEVRDLLVAARVGFLSSTWAVGMLALGSLRQLTVRDIILITILVVVVNFFMKRVTL